MKIKTIQSIVLSFCFCNFILNDTRAQKPINEELFYVASYNFIHENWSEINPHTQYKSFFRIDSMEFISAKHIFNFPFSAIFENQELIQEGFIENNISRKSVYYYHNQKLLSDTFIIKPIFPDENIESRNKLLMILGFSGVFKFNEEYLVIAGFTDQFVHHNHTIIIKMDEKQRVLGYSYLNQRIEIK